VIDNTEEVAEKFSEAGVKRLHIVDLDAAKGVGENKELMIFNRAF
jgi:phosphoribosylformimino-5-aminoimidazole carboxamide ribonucleotide (ProFAR) isomerase